MKRKNLIAYALDFASFLLDDLGDNIEQVILFGSVARGEFNEESDVDLFIDTKKEIKDEVIKVLSLFRSSEAQRKWELKGIKNELSLKIGNLDEWKLKRSIISDGILLYGKFASAPEKMEAYTLFNLSFAGLKKSEQVRIWRRLYGYKQKVGKRVYKTTGLIENLNGQRFESSVVIAAKNRKKIIDFLRKEKIKYLEKEIWSDSI